MRGEIIIFTSKLNKTIEKKSNTFEAFAQRDTCYFGCSNYLLCYNSCSNPDYSADLMSMYAREHDIRRQQLAE